MGRYLTGTVGANHVSKAMTLQEVRYMENAGLSVFPIYQDGGYYSDYFASPRQGIVDALTAINAADLLGFPSGTTIYFAVDFDAYGFQIDDLVVPYFQQISGVFHSQKNESKFKVGVYGPRLVCKEVSSRGYASTSFVADMSTGFSGNLGYPIPKNWAFDQFHEFTFDSSPSFPLDKDAYSGLDKAASHFDNVREYTPDDLERLNLKTRVEAAKQAFIRYVLEPLGFYGNFVNYELEHDRSVRVNHVSSGAFDVDVDITVSETVGMTSGWFGTINIAVDNSGDLTVETKNQISGSSATFDFEHLGSSLDFEQRLMLIAASVKSGTISYRIASTESGQLILDIKAESDNLAPGSSGLETRLSVTVSYILTPRGTGVSFQMPEMSPETVLVGVGVVAVIALFVVTPVDEIGVAGAAALKGLRILGVLG